MAAEHLTTAELTGAARGDLSPTDLLRASDHLLLCGECRARVREIAGPMSRPVAEPEVTYDLLADYLDDKLDPLRREEVTETLRNSPRAAADFASLRHFRDQTNALPSLTSKGIEIQEVLNFPRTVGRWILPLAALFLFALAGFWWQSHSAKTPNLVTSQTLNSLAPDLRAAVINAEQTGTLPIATEIVSLGGKREKLAGTPNDRPGFRLVRPKATAIRETRPRFEWTARAGASSYRILVVDLQSGDLVARGQSGATTSWQPQTALAAGASYQWQVEALRGTEVLERVPRPPEPEARFTILSAQAARKFEKLEEENHDSPLVIAVAAARVGLLEKASAELRALTKANPDSLTARRLLANAEEQLGYSRPTTTNGAQ